MTKKRQNYLVVDLEGTCCDDDSVPPDERETIEIGAVIVDGESLEAEQTWSSLVKPVRCPVLTEFCTNLTGIGQQDVDTACEFPDAFGGFCNWVVGHGDSLFCSWGRYDKDQFRRDCMYHGMEYPFREHLDLSKLFTRKTGKRRGHRGAMKVLGVEPEGDHHRGLSDAMNIAKMLPLLLGD